MKVKHISKLLVSSILLSSLNISSFASAFPEGDMYETLEGSSITVNDTQEEEKVDVEIEGKTLVNLIKNGESGTSIPSQGADFELTSSVASDKKYTLIFHSDAPNIYGGFLVDTSTWGDRFDEGQSVSGLNKILINVNGSYNTIRLRQDSTTVNYKNVMLLEGDWRDKEIPEYFEGIKSVGESENGSHSIELKSQNENLFLGFDHSGFKMRQVPDDRVLIKEKNRLKFITNGWNQGFYFDMYGSFKKGETLYMNKKDLPFDFVKETTSSGTVYTYETQSLDQKFWMVKNDCAKIQFLFKNGLESTTYDIQDFAVYRKDKSEYIESQYSDKAIPLSEPLRGMPNGVKDRIIKKDNQWVIERNCSELIFDGDENWITTGVGCNDNFTTFSYEFNAQNSKSTQVWSPEQIDRAVSDRFSCIGDELYFSNVANEGFAQGHSETQSTDRWYISISNGRLSSINVSAFKEWLSKNPVTILYQLENPIYEPLNIDSTVNLYLNTTYISNNSIVPANMKIVIVDRIAARAKGAVEVAKGHSTRENLSEARYWTNLMRESILKDSLQNELNSIVDIEVPDVEKKSATLNADIYVGMKNVLSLSLDTNSIVFDEVDATEATELKNAINLSVVSSLPYRINAYLEDEIYNADKSNKLDKSVLNIKANESDNYQVFAGLSSAVTLLDDQDSGTNNIHGVDLRLLFNTAHKVDVYKTAIKFEVEQK